MDRNFAKSLALVLKSEGGWSDNPKDPGGATMKGVTLANFRRYVKADATKDDLRHITDAQVATVYRRFYWDAVAGAELPDGVDYATFDFAVNSGPSRAAKYLQGVLGILQDGRIGPATVKAAQGKKPDAVVNALCDARLSFLQRLPTWGDFGKGWTSRVTSVRSAALAMAVQPAPEPSTVVVDSLPAAPAQNATVATVDGPKKDETTVVITKTPQAPPASPGLPTSKTGFLAIGAIIIAIITGIIKFFGG